MRTMATMVERTKPCCNQKKIKIELKSQLHWTAVLAFLGLISMAQLADELWVPTWSREYQWVENDCGMCACVVCVYIKRTESLSSRAHFRFQFPHKTKHFRQGLPRFCQFYNGVSILNIGFKIHNKASRVTDHLSRYIIIISK